MADQNENVKLLVFSQQAWFRPFVEVQDLPPFPIKAISSFRLDNLGAPYLRLLIGKGPVCHQLQTLPELYFEHGEEDYPVFQSPGIGPSGAALKCKLAKRTVEADEDQALFFIEVVVLRPVPADWARELQSEENPMVENGKVMWGEARHSAHQRLSELRQLLEIVVGAYALYQYPLVWHNIANSPNLFIINPDTKAVTSSTAIYLDTFIPLKLQVSGKIEGVKLSDAVGQNAEALAKLDLQLPFLLLQKTLWQDDVNIRFLMEFWILEHLAQKHSRTQADVRELEAFAKKLKEFVSKKLPQFETHFKKRMGALTRPTLAEAFCSYARDRGLCFDKTLFRRATELRNRLSHGQPVDADELCNVEPFFRKLARKALRTEIETHGVFLREGENG